MWILVEGHMTLSSRTKYIKVKVLNDKISICYSFNLKIHLLIYFII